MQFAHVHHTCALQTPGGFWTVSKGICERQLENNFDVILQTLALWDLHVH